MLQVAQVKGAQVSRPRPYGRLETRIRSFRARPVIPRAQFQGDIREEAGPKRDAAAGVVQQATKAVLVPMLVPLLFFAAWGEKPAHAARGRRHAMEAQVVQGITNGDDAGEAGALRQTRATLQGYWAQVTTRWASAKDDVSKSAATIKLGEVASSAPPALRELLSRDEARAGLGAAAALAAVLFVFMRASGKQVQREGGDGSGGRGGGEAATSQDEAATALPSAAAPSPAPALAPVPAAAPGGPRLRGPPLLGALQWGPLLSSPRCGP